MRVKTNPRTGCRVVVDGNKGLVDERWAKAQQARSRGAITLHARGKAHRFNSVTGRKAIRRLWDRRYRFNKHVGRRLGHASKHRPGVTWAGFRALYANSSTSAVFYMPCNGTWWRKPDEGLPYKISERAALVALGHLPRPKGRGRVPGTNLERKGKS
jgi:hypothetical protein